MDWQVIAEILAVVGLAVLFGWMEKRKVESPIAWIAVVIGLFVWLLWPMGWLGKALLLVMAALASLDHLPRWIGLILAGVIAGYYIRFIISAFAQGIDNIALEQQKTNARIELLENSLRRKLDDIASRLPEKDEPDYLNRIREEGKLN